MQRSRVNIDDSLTADDVCDTMSPPRKEGCMENKETNKALRVLLTVGLVLILLVYAAALFKIVLAKYGFAAGLRELNLAPLRFLQGDATVDTSVVLKNVLGNIALFIPLGVLVPALSRRPRFWETLLCGVLLSLCFEALQYAFSWGASDIDDLILNTLGTLVGAGIYFLLFLHKKKYLLAKGLSFLFLTLFGIAGVLALWLYNPGTLPSVIEHVGQEQVQDLEAAGRDLDGYALSLADGTLTLQDGRTEAARDGVVPKASYPLTDDARLYTMTLSAQYSPNGNVQKTFVTYAPATVQEIAALLQSGDGNFVDLWLEGDKAAAAVFTVYQDR